VAVLLLFIAAACEGWGPHPERVRPAKARKMTFVERNYARVDTDCAGRDACATLRLSWPVVGEGEPGARTAVTQAIDKFVLARVAEKGQAATPDEVGASFLDAYRRFRAANPNSPQIWTVTRAVRVLDSTPEVVSLAFDAALFTGGPHPVSLRLLASFDAKNGRPIGLADLVPEKRLENLRRLVEQGFREARAVRSGTDLESAGFTFEGGIFRLTDNFAVVGGGLMFHWNPGEVAPYSKGGTEVRVSREDVKRIASLP
jgi:hypothetical protein